MIDLPPLYTREAYNVFKQYVEGLSDQGLKRAYEIALADVLVPPVQISANEFSKALKFNPNHEPGGSSVGGRFAHGKGAGSSGEPAVHQAMALGPVIDLAELFAQRITGKPPLPSREEAGIAPPDSPGIQEQTKRLAALGIEVGGNHPTLVDESAGHHRAQPGAVPLYLTAEQFEPVLKGVADEVEYLKTKGVDLTGIKLRINDSGLHVHGADAVTFHDLYHPDMRQEMFFDPTSKMSPEIIQESIKSHQDTGVWFSASTKGQVKMAQGGGINDWVRYTVRHEMGHVLCTPELLDAIERRPGKFQPLLLRKHISLYGSREIPEAVAETFAKVMDPEYVKGSIPPIFESLTKKIIHAHEPPKVRVARARRKALKPLQQPIAASTYPTSKEDFKLPTPSEWPPLGDVTLSVRVIKFDEQKHPREPSGHGRKSGRFIHALTRATDFSKQGDLELVGGEKHETIDLKPLAGEAPIDPNRITAPNVDRAGHTGGEWGTSKASVLGFTDRFDGEVIDTHRMTTRARHKLLAQLNKLESDISSGDGDYDSRQIASNAIYFAKYALSDDYHGKHNRSFVAVAKDGTMRGAAVLADHGNGLVKLDYLGSFQRGVGSTLLRTVEDYAREHLHGTHLYLISSNYAEPFYTHEGFHKPRSTDPRNTQGADYVKPLNARRAAHAHKDEYEEPLWLLAVSPEFAAAAGTPPAVVQKFDESKHPRDSKGTPTGGHFRTAGEIAAEGGTTLADLRKFPGMDERREAFANLTQEQRDALAAPRTAISERINDLLGDDKPFTSVDSYLKEYDDILPHDNKAEIAHFLNTLHDDALAAGVSEAHAVELQHQMARLMVAQDYEAAHRTLGDHGVYHLKGDADMAKSVLGVLPSQENTPINRLKMDIAAAVHDIGYLTPTAREWLDMGHPRWGQQFFQTHVAPNLEKMIGKDATLDVGNLIQGHEGTTLDWENNASQSAFSLSDNMALFHREKMPPMLRHVKANVNVLVHLGESLMGQDPKSDHYKELVATARSTMRDNVDKAILSPQMKEAYNHAVNEVSGVLPKYTLGMVGTVYKGVVWNTKEKAVEVHLEKHHANEGLARIVDFHAKQFEKLAETYHSTAEELLKTGSMTFFDRIKKKAVLLAKLRIRKEDGFLAALLRRMF